MLCSVIGYGNIFLSSVCDSDLDDLEILQNDAIRCCYGISDPRDQNVINLHLRANTVETHLTTTSIKRPPHLKDTFWLERNISLYFMFELTSLIRPVS